MENIPGPHQYVRVALATTAIGLLTIALLQVRVDATIATTSPAVDLNGDGNGDVFTYNPTTGDWARQVSLAGGGFTTNVGKWSPGWTVAPVSFNSDALTDFFLFNAMSGTWFKMVNDGVGFTTQSTGVWWPGWERDVLDLDADGLSDLFLYDPATGQWFRCLSTATGFDYIQGVWSPGWEVLPMTLNTDGFGDLFLIDRATGRWFWVVGEADGTFSYPQSGYWAPNWALYAGDFDGDERDDWFLYRRDAGEFYVAMNNGAGYTYVAGYGWAAGWNLTVLDLNADGWADLFLYNKTTGQWLELQGDGAGQFATVGQGAWTPGWDLYPTDFNGDGRADLLLYKPITGEWFQALNDTISAFTYVGGQWQGALNITATVSVTSPSPVPPACLVTTTDLTLGNTTLTLNGCGAAVGGNLSGTNVNATITGTPTPQVNVAGTCSGTCSAMGTLSTGTAAPVDPLAGLAAPTNPGGCVAGVSATLSPGCYTSIASSVTTLNAGVYYVTGLIDIGTLTGTHVMIYLTGAGQLTAGNNKSLTLTAPTSGPYTGIAIFQNPSNTNGFDAANNLSLSVSGAIYMPGVNQDFKNALSIANTDCTLFLARAVNFKNANGTLSSNGCATAFGGAGFFSRMDGSSTSRARPRPLLLPSGR